MLSGKKKDNISCEEQELLQEIRTAKNALEAAYSNFQQATEPELIDCCIYLMTASQLRYKFLISRARKLNVQNTKLDDLCEISILTEKD
jgi:hypothetical protein